MADGRLLDALLLVESPLQRAFDDGSLPQEVFNATRAALEDGSVAGAVSLLAAHAGAPEWASKMLTELVKTGNATTSGNVEAARLAVEGASGGAPETYTRLLLEFAIDAGVVNASGLPASVVAPLVPKLVEAAAAGNATLAVELLADAAGLPDWSTRALARLAGCCIDCTPHRPSQPAGTIHSTVGPKP